jgi:hypothetical protein
MKTNGRQLKTLGEWNEEPIVPVIWSSINEGKSFCPTSTLSFPNEEEIFMSCTETFDSIPLHKLESAYAEEKQAISYVITRN